MKAIGLDIGTTTICGSVIDGLSGAVIESVTIPNDSSLKGSEAWEKIQDPAVILTNAKEVISRFLLQHKPIKGIGITGQMHGILYLNANGNAISPLYTWQDGRGELPAQDGRSYVEGLSLKTGYKLATGFGAVTHYYNMQHAAVPSGAKCFCTIHDYVAMKLAGCFAPVTHISDAASFGLFDLERGCFDSAALENAELKAEMFPAVTKGFDLLGKTEDNVPVFVAIGDNQASFIGSVRDMKNSILVNVGTGSQISLYAQKFTTDSSMETRPCIDNSYLMTGSSLCGGRAYAILEKFFTSVAELSGIKSDLMYPLMDRLSEGYASLPNKLQISTKFSGTRENPSLRGSIINLREDNFTPQHFVCGILEGTVNELYEKYHTLGDSAENKPSLLIGSGNGIRKSTVLQQMFSQKFGMTVKIPKHKEEAAYGAALFVLVGAGVYQNIEEAQKIIKYQGE
jgi:sedoheptulokinase